MSAAPPNPNAPLPGSAASIDRAGLVALIWTCFGVATTALSLRLAIRWRLNSRLLLDDYWMIWAWLCVLTMTILQTEQMSSLWFMTSLRAGRIGPEPEDILEQNYQLTRWQFPIIKLFYISLWSVKASLLSIFYRLIKSFPVLRKCWIFVVVVSALALLGCILSSALTCNPPSDYFKGNCSSPQELWNQRFNVIYSTTVDVVTDLMIMALPIAALPALQLDKRKKIGLAVVFALGVVIICVSIVRMTQVVVKDAVDLVGLALWSAVETSTALVVGSLPPLKSFLVRGVKKYSSKMSNGKIYPGDGSHENSDSRPSRAVIVSESILLDDRHESCQTDGGIYVQKTVVSADVQAKTAQCDG